MKKTKTISGYVASDGAAMDCGSLGSDFAKNISEDRSQEAVNA